MLLHALPVVNAAEELEATDHQGYTPLHVAATKGHSEVISALIEAGSDPNTCLPTTSETPLYSAVAGGHLDAVRVLLRAKADTLCLGEGGAGVVFPLEIAVYRGHTGVVRELLQQVGIGGGGVALAALAALSLSTVSGCSPRVAQLLVDAGMDTELAVQLGPFSDSDDVVDGTLLARTNRRLRQKKIAGEDATEEQLNGLEGMRRLLMRVEAVRAISWLWSAQPTLIARAEGCACKGERNTGGTPLRRTLPLLRRRAARPGVLLRPAFR